MAVLLCFRMCKADAHFARTLMIRELRDSIIRELFRESRSRRKTHVGHDSSSQFLSDLSLYGPLERVLHLDDILFTQTHALLPGNTALWDVIRMLPLLGMMGNVSCLHTWLLFWHATSRHAVDMYRETHFNHKVITEPCILGKKPNISLFEDSEYKYIYNSITSSSVMF